MNKYVGHYIKNNKDTQYALQEQNGNYNSDRKLLGEIKIPQGRRVQSCNTTV